MTTEPPGGLHAALAALQATLPRIGKDATGQYGKYADLADVSAAVLPLLGRHGLSFACTPTLTEDGAFVLDYALRHVSGETLGGRYPLPDMKVGPQQLGSAITYARRYCLCAVTGAAPDSDDDDGQAASTARPSRPRQQRQAPPERAPANLPRNADGTISRSRVTDAELDAAGEMTSTQLAEHTALRRGADGKLPAAERDKVQHGPLPDSDDPWTGHQPGELRAPQPAGNIVAVLQQHFKRLEVTDREERLGITSRITGRTIDSTNDLTAGEGVQLKRTLEGCRDRQALMDLLEVKAGA